MGVTIVVRSASSDAAEPPLSLTLDAPRIVIGRGDGCEVRLPDTSVSLRHASLRQHGGSYLIVDEGSVNGTFVGGVRLAPHAPRVITHGDKVKVGRVWIELRFDPIAVPSPPHATRELALSLVLRGLTSMGEPGRPRLVIEQGPDEAKVLRLDEPGRVYVMGRGPGLDLTLEETDASRQHVQLVRKAEQLYVRDLGSKNGTFVASQRLDAHRDVILRPGDVVRIGHDILRYEHEAALALAELEHADDEHIDEASEYGAPFEDEPVEEDDEDDQDEDDLDDSPAETLHAPYLPSTPIAPPHSTRNVRITRGRGRSGNSGGGWSASDFVILLLALGVLALSLGGLWLLFRS